MSTGLESLIDMFRPAGGPFRYDWEGAEARLGASIPRDYKELTAAFGDANFCEALDILVPSANEVADIAANSMENREYLTDPYGGEDRPSETPAGKPFDPATLITWGNYPGGDYWLWHPDPDDPLDPAKYDVLFASTDQTVWRFFPGLATTDVLYAFVSGTDPEFQGELGVAGFLQGRAPFVDIARSSERRRFVAR